MVSPLEIHAVAGAVMDTQFADAFSHRLDIPRMSEGQPIQPRKNYRPGAYVFQTHPPFSECRRLLQLDHRRP